MFRHILYRSALLVFLALPAGAIADDDFHELIVFGDSLSDNGNLAALPDFSFLSSPFLPFDDGFSNGPRAVEVLAGELGLEVKPSRYLLSLSIQGTNFAVAGARSVDLDPAFPIDLPSQVGVFLASRGGAAPADALYVVFIGGNDIRDARDATSAANARAFIRDAVAGVAAALELLAGAGAEHILLANAPDIGAIPETRLLSGGSPAFSRRATALTRMFNRGLAKAARRTGRAHDVDILQFDTFRFLRRLIARSGRLGFINDRDPCFFTSLFLGSGGTEIRFHPECNGGLNFDRFVFFDEIHPTAEVHRRAGRAIAELVEDGDDHDDEDEHDED